MYNNFPRNEPVPLLRNISREGLKWGRILNHPIGLKLDHSQPKLRQIWNSERRWKIKRIIALSTLLVLIAGLLVGTGSAGAEPWKFGVMADTQWTAPTDPAGKNPNGVSVSIINQISSSSSSTA